MVVSKRRSGKVIKKIIRQMVKWTYHFWTKMHDFPGIPNYIVYSMYIVIQHLQSMIFKNWNHTCFLSRISIIIRIYLQDIFIDICQVLFLKQTILSSCSWPYQFRGWYRGVPCMDVREIKCLNTRRNEKLENGLHFAFWSRYVKHDIYRPSSMTKCEIKIGKKVAQK